ncbi:VOC family protein [Chitinophagaceae bacterium MMS25-I14]
MQKIMPFLWFDNNAEEAMNFYTSLFPDSKVLSITRYGAAGPGPEGSVLTASFLLNGQEFAVLNGGLLFKFTEAVSFAINCADQKEIDYYWDKLTADGGEESMCGWLKDKYGLSWQVVPANISKLLQNPDKDKANRTMQALMGMKKLVIADLEGA